MAEAVDVEAGFREFVAARSTAMLRTAYLLTGDWATAEDLLQVSLTKTYLAWKRLGRIDAVEAYARRVLINTSTSWWRRRWHRERPTESVPEMSTPDSTEMHVERDALWRLVKTLPPRQRAVLVLRFYEDMSEADTARLLDVSVGTVKSQCARALASLRERMAVAEPANPAGSEPDRPAVSRLTTRLIDSRLIDPRTMTRGSVRAAGSPPLLAAGGPPRARGHIVGRQRAPGVRG